MHTINIKKQFWPKKNIIYKFPDNSNNINHITLLQWVLSLYIQRHCVCIFSNLLPSYV